MSLLSPDYDRINGEAYAPYARFLAEHCFPMADIPVREVLDLGCGTGGICRILAANGFDTVALDNDLEMLELAQGNCGGETLLLCQDMREFELYGTVQAVYSSFDCLNYIISGSDLKKVFALVHNYLEPGGVFVFDVNTQYRYKNVFDGRSYVYEFENGLLIWRSALDVSGAVCDFTIDRFTETARGSYKRETETQTQRFHPESAILNAANGFTLLEKSGGKGFDGCAENEKDYYIFKRD